MSATIEAVVVPARRAVRALPAPGVSAETCSLATMENAALEDRISELSAHIHAATHRLLVLIAEFDRRGGWAAWGTRSCAHWLNWKCGIDLGAAREKVRVAHALASLPDINAAFACGALSYSKVRAMTRVATPANEDYLLMIAQHGTAHHVEKMVRQYRRSVRLAERSAALAQFASRGVDCHYDEDGMLVLRARLPAETGALLLQALDAAVVSARSAAADVSAETSRESVGARRADALALLAESFLASGPAELSGGDRQQVVVHVAAETLATTDSNDCCHLEEGPRIAADSARRLACDGSVVTIARDARGEPLDVGRKTRSIPPVLRRALQVRDGGCRFPGCTNTRFVDGHHIRHWADGGETKLRNLVLLCRHHHRLLHEGGFGVSVLDDGALRFTRADGCGVESGPGHPPVADWRAVVTANGLAGLQIDARTGVTLWRGEALDYLLALEGLWRRDGGQAPGGPG